MLQLWVIGAHRHISIQTCRRDQVFRTGPFSTGTASAERPVLIARPVTHTAPDIVSTKAPVLGVVSVEGIPTPLFPLDEWYRLMPGYSTVVPGRHKSQALPWVIVWTAKSSLVVDPAPFSSVTVGSLDQGLCHRRELLRRKGCA
eukprot:1290497-Amphidinium_carterae.1